MARDKDWTGVVLILVGTAFLLNTLDLVDIGDMLRFWPLILIAIGLRLVIRDRRRGSPPPADAPPPPPAT